MRVALHFALPVCLALALSGPAALAQDRASPPAQGTASADPARLSPVLERARAFPSLRTLIISQNGTVLTEEVFRGPAANRPVNVKSASKTILSALVGIAIEKDLLDGVDQPAVALLDRSAPPDPDPRLGRITIGHLLSMRAGLERTSGANYGRWIESPNWVRYVLSRPFVDEPGGRMLYSTGSTHLLSAILTRVSRDSTLDLAREWLGKPLDIDVAAWTRDPQGIYLGGNEMALSPRALLRFGEMYRQGGMIDGRRVVPESWVKASWEPRTASPFTGDSYGYGWFIRQAGDHTIYYAWGYGGQMLYVVPSLGLTVVMTSDPTAPSGRTGYVRDLHALLANGIIPAVSGARDDAAAASPAGGRS
ncbi:serine hydrolase domain-containing protein [Microvirga pudoricolor]|uniref:serine hydrolase domain-containing protein n=1 Tax=Microvirga pudoricolor TaxID=2778729 RepID=UPI00194F8D18|nr:serine hydrolase [Microvirga pudoricolor]MBM6592540.1 serine hydrolase [Microvirga pudoricolor]